LSPKQAEFAQVLYRVPKFCKDATAPVDEQDHLMLKQEVSYTKCLVALQFPKVSYGMNQVLTLQDARKK
jgi:hypothetical protein